MGEIQYTDADILGSIRHLGDTLNRTPVADDVRSHEGSGVPDLETIRRRFGSWSIALSKAGFVPKYNLSQEATIESILSFMFHHAGRQPTKRECTAENGLPASQTIRNKFGTLSSAMDIATKLYEEKTASSKDV